MLILIFFVLQHIKPREISLPNLRWGGAKTIIAHIIHVLASALIVYAIITFYLARQYPDTLGFNKTLFKKDGLYYYMTFLIIEFLPTVVIIILCGLKRYTVPTLVKFSIAAIVLITFFRYGRFNDLVMKLSLPFLFILMIFHACVIMKVLRELSIVAGTLVAVYLLLTMPSFVSDYSFGLRANRPVIERDIYIIRQYAGSRRTH
ncbi:hypothetical protein ACFL0T_05035 [Candidatus Omnitrophota bacterium]